MAARLLDVGVEVGLFAVLLLSPLLFGSVAPWAQSGLELLVAITAGMWVTRMAVDGRLAIRESPLLWPGVAMLLVIGIQLALPGQSVNAYATSESFRLFAAYLVFLMVLSAHLVTPARIVRLVSVLVLWGTALASWGLVNQALGREVVVWFEKEFYRGRLVSTFVNANHQALYFAVLLFLALGMLLRPARRSRTPGPGRPGVASAPLRGTGAAARVLYGGAAVVLGVALVLTASRGGVAALVAGVLTLGTLVLVGRTRGGVMVGLFASLAVFAGYMAWIGTDALSSRMAILAREPFTDLRWEIWRATLRVTAEAPILGVGLGAFEDAVIAHRPTGLRDPFYVEAAHNDYLQLLAEGGAVSFVILGWAAATWLTFVVGRWRDRQDVFARGFVMGGLGAVAAVAFQSGVDFGLHMPGNAFLVVAVLALLPAVVTLRAHRAGLQVDLHEWRWDLSLRPRVCVGLLALLLVTVAGVVLVPAAVADWRQRDAHRLVSEKRLAEGVVPTADLARAERELRAAATLDPWSPRIQKEWAVVAAELGQRIWTYGVSPEGVRLRPAAVRDRLAASQELFTTAYRAYERSVRSEPRVSLTQWRFGWFLADLEGVRRAVGAAGVRESVTPELSGTLGSNESLLPRALRHLQEAVRLDPESPRRRTSLMAFAVAHRAEIPEARTIVAQEAHEAIRLDRRVLPDVVRMLTAPGVEPDLLWLAVPREPRILVELASILDQRGHTAAAGVALEDAVGTARVHADQVAVLLARARFLLRQGNKTLALAQARQALALVPTEAESYAALAETYEANGLLDDAAAALSSALARAGSGDPRKANAYRASLAALLERRGDLGEALALRRESVKALPNDAGNHLELARLLEARQAIAEALREYEIARELGQRDWHLQHTVAAAFVRQGLLREAAAAAERAVRLNPEADDLRVELGDLYTRIGSVDRAREQYQIVLTRQPAHQAATRGLRSIGELPSPG
jgi:tetratricopeptide (TPR) repeat protein/O-antigen ligase